MTIIRHKAGVLLELLVNGSYRIHWVDKYNFFCEIDFKNKNRAIAFYNKKVNQVTQLELNF